MITSLSELYNWNQMTYRFGTNERSGFYELWQQHKKLKTIEVKQYFYLLMEKPLGCCFQIQSSYYQAAQYNQKTVIPVSLG